MNTPDKNVRPTRRRWRQAFGGSLAISVLAVATVSCIPSGAPRYPGDINGGICLGFSAPAFEEKLLEVGANETVCVHRSFFQWGNVAGMEAQIKRDHAANRLPWISVRGPGSTKEGKEFAAQTIAGWQSITNGGRNADLEALASMLKRTTLTDSDPAKPDKPAILTFHHEPDNDVIDDVDGQKWAAAYKHFHDRLNLRSALVNVSDPPIVMEWLLNPKNQLQNPRVNWLTADVTSRMPFLGLDVYENASGRGLEEKLADVYQWMADNKVHGKIVGIAEMGCTDKDFPSLTAVQCMDKNYQWAKANPDKIGIISYFNSMAESKPNVYWPLDEGQPTSDAKMRTFKKWLHDPAMLNTHPL